MLAGDFNCLISDLPVWDDFRARGFHELHSLVRERFGIALPPTCRGSTSHDSVILSSSLVPFLDTAWVDVDSNLFDAHSPVYVRLRAPHMQPQYQAWRLPDSWEDLAPEVEAVSAAYDRDGAAVLQAAEAATTQDQLASAFLLWARTWGDAVHDALRAQHLADPLRHPAPGLPRRCRGRCVPRVKKTRLVPQPMKAARHGDFFPNEEPLTIRAKQRVRQARRLQTLLRGLRSALRRWGGLRLMPAAVLRQLRGEWHACLRAPGYGRPWRLWMLSVAHFAWIPVDVPDVSWLEDALCYVQFDSQAETQRAARHRIHMALAAVRRDVGLSSARGFRGLRPHSHPAVQSIPVHERQEATLIASSAADRAMYACAHPHAFQPGAAAALSGRPVKVVAVWCGPMDSELLELLMDFPPPSRGELVQDTAACTPQELSTAFLKFWFPIWNRDSRQESEDIGRWSSFLQLFPDRPDVQVAFDASDPSLWRAALRRLKVGRSPGCCGFTPQELKGMPDNVLLGMTALFASVQRLGFPKSLLKAWVASVPKAACPNSVAQLRPITVLATLYRVWSSALARALLQQWSVWLPSGIRGSLPHRGPRRDISLAVELQVERAIRAKQGIAGFSVDIIKYFNHIPRAPAACVLQMMGCPTDALQVWISALSCIERLPKFGKHYGAALPSTCGAPEEDPMSVACQAALAWALFSFLEREHLQTLIYVDNWAWIAGTRFAFSCALTEVQQFCAALSLDIDWAKSYCWGTSADLRQWLASTVPGLIPPQATLSVVNCARDLGVCFRYRAAVGKDAARFRFQEGLLRLRRLEGMARPVANKLRLLVAGVWPMMFYGMESQLIPVSEVMALRSRASKAILGHSSCASPFLLLSQEAILRFICCHKRFERWARWRGPFPTWRLGCCDLPG